MKPFNQDLDDMLPANGRKSTYIKEQHNENCQQFFGNIYGCTFTMPSAPPRSSKATKRLKPQKKAAVAVGEKPMTIKYYKHDNKGLLRKQRQRVDVLYKKWTEWGWIDENTQPDDFDRLFEGSPCHCNITWTGTNATLTKLFQILLKESFIEKQTKCSAKYLVANQFGKTQDCRSNRLDEETKTRIYISIFILDTRNPLPQRNDVNAEEYDIRDAALYEIYEGMLRSTKGI